MADLMETLRAIGQDPELTKKFVADPEGTLRDQGVDTSDMRVSRSSDERDARPDRLTARERDDLDIDVTQLRAGNMQMLEEVPATALTICGSVGYVVCGSVGE